MERTTATKLGCLVMGGLLLSAPTRRMEDFGDFIGNYNFRIEIDGVDAGQFTAVDGLSVELEVVEYQDGDDVLLRKRPGRVKYGDITLKKGYIASTVLNDWIEAARCGNGDYTRKNMSIVLCDNTKRRKGDGMVCSTWTACNVFPRRWTLNSRDTIGDSDTQVVTEEITFAIEQLIYEPDIFADRKCRPPPLPPPPR